MKNISLLFVLLFAQSALALTGLVESKTLGNKTITLDFAAVKALPANVTAEVHVDQETQDATCAQYLRFPNLAQALFSMNGVRVQENMNAVVQTSSEDMAALNECAPTAVRIQNPVTVSLHSVLNPQFVISESVENNVLTQTVLVLSSPNHFISADLQAVTSEFYTLQNVQFPQELKMNFYVVKVSPGTTSYLEHGTVVLK